jgi:hypothetical protein
MKDVFYDLHFFHWFWGSVGLLLPEDVANHYLLCL